MTGVDRGRREEHVGGRHAVIDHEFELADVAAVGEDAHVAADAEGTPAWSTQRGSNALSLGP
jgi:hypothetical protein